MSMHQTQLNLLTDCLESLNSVKNLMYEYLPSNELKQTEKRLKNIVESYCEIEDTSKKSALALEETRNYLDSNTITNQSIDEMYENKLQELNSSRSSNPKNHKIWKQIFDGQLDSEVSEIAHPRPRPEDVEFTEVDESLSCCSVFAPPRDPISQTVIANPCKSLVCGHIFEHKFIMEFIKRSKKDVKCPYRGCRNYSMKVEELVEDCELKQKIEDYLERNRDNNSDDDDD